MSDWTFYTNVDFHDPAVKMYAIDTRDFHCYTDTEEYEQPDLSKIIHYKERFFFTADEVVEIITRLFNESGGPVEWRMLTLSGEGYEWTANWQIKYIRIHRTPHGLIMCNNNHYALKREVWNCPVAQEHLNAH